jgi:hypothetical protein
MLLRYGAEVGSCEYGSATAGSRNDVEYVDLLIVYYFFIKVSNPQSSFIYNADNYNTFLFRENGLQLKNTSRHVTVRTLPIKSLMFIRN